MSTIDRLQAIAFRLRSHHLDHRLDPGSLLDAAGVVGLQNTPPGAALLSLYARIDGLEAGMVERALEVEKTLLQAWSLRAAPRIFPTTAAPVFTTGALPRSEEDIRRFIRGVEQALDRTGLSARELVRLTGRALIDLLDSRELDKDTLGVEGAAWILPHLPQRCSEAWQEASWYAAGQSLGESMVRFALPVTALQGVCCHACRRDGAALLARADRWLEGALPGMIAAGEAAAGQDGAGCEAALVRRYLHAYGPSTVNGFAEWAGISPGQAARAWAAVEGEMTEVNFANHPAWVLAADMDDMERGEMPSGARLLPAHDPYLELRDRATVVGERASQRVVWRTVGSPGVLLVDGQAAGVWRARKQGRLLWFALSPFAPLAPKSRLEVEAEAGGMAHLRGCAEARCEWQG